MKIHFYLLFSTVCTFLACTTEFNLATEQTTQVLSIEKLKPIIQARGTTWGKALRNKNIDLLNNLYDDNAHYLPNDAPAFHGKEAILKYWQESFTFLGDLQLNMETLEGSITLLYETGNGTVKIIGQDGNYFDMPFKYVNVWKRQIDGTYNIVVDTFNNLPDE